MHSYILRNLLRSRRILRESFAKNKEILTYSQLKQSRQFSNNSGKKSGEAEKIDVQKDDDHNLTAPINAKYKVFQDEDADVIFDVTEEQHKIDLELLTAQEQFHDPYAGINLERGTTGVYDIEDLVILLELNKAKNIFVASVPKEYAYVDYIVVVTGSSIKHMRALVTFVRKVYKLKRHKTDKLPKIEGEMSNEWIAIDLGNIALHVFSTSSREHYDLETLWTVGSQYDDKTNLTKEMDIMEQFNTFLAEFEPVENK
ncbi:uncharacterized protein LOC116845782 isoform X2 [Odontomachus brunneus]|uniref:uncharacterized protein LOC116845782 isoform X1 n=1 Tax=Odontomachus brunneus TaxID=486640 RepID=UPI0013F1B3B7|nr:uncharacterized protein LOC116845782 isoform X1 [Odontomachus brunneus]XP_032674762.1 uncharacterized protein LOC116845782 isoform X1 [Odontomachus brunneus]XP_032674763.1 uncharacterized protein LOC116845782 isoform X2 [Odontomachus brunneus]